MRTRSEEGKLYGPARLLEMLEFRFGAFEAIAYAAIELARTCPDARPAMDGKTADAILEFADDLHQAYEAALEWCEPAGAQRGAESPSR
jgi:hypothetical protein